jgi:hypothetical protein
MCLCCCPAIDDHCRNATKQWLLGDAVLVSPVITPHTNSLSAYFTAGSWYSAWDYSRMDMPQGAPVKLRVPVGDIAVHYRGGSIVPMQQYAAVTKDVRLSPITLVVALPSQPSNGRVSTMSPVPPYALDQTCVAAHARNAGQLVSCGFLYMDGGEDITVSADNSVQVWYTAAASPSGDAGTITNVVHSDAGAAQGKLVIEAIHILGVPKANSTVPLEGASLPSVKINGQVLDSGYDASSGVIKLTGLNVPVGEPLQLRWKL